MRIALFDSDIGYYTRNIDTIGRQGDFTTTPVVGTLLAASVYNWQKQIRRSHPCLREAPFVEIGAGSGKFALDFLRRKSFWQRADDYWIVETSPPLQDVQRKTLKKHNIRWFSTPQEALSQSGGRAIFFSNELVDAFPCSRWIYSGGSWKEHGILLQGTTFCESARDSPLPDSTVFSQLELRKEGQLVETHESFHEWFADWSPLARQAAILTIDYGALVGSLYARRPGGSLRGYWQQNRLTGNAIYARVGRQDLTADVNFTDLTMWSEQLGWHTQKAVSLATWLEHNAHAGGGIRPGPASADARILDEADAGGAFQVLEATKV